MFPLRSFPQLMIEEEARSLREGDLEMRLKKKKQTGVTGLDIGFSIGRTV